MDWLNWLLLPGQWLGDYVSKIPFNQPLTVVGIIVSGLFALLAVSIFVGVLTGGTVGPVPSWLMRARQRDAAAAEREAALDVLAQHGMAAHYYLPATGIEDAALATAARRLAGLGFLITDANGNLVGKVATARLSSEEAARERRASFQIVCQD